jgi:hypothetical protein
MTDLFLYSSTATISPCGQYRYVLERRWEDGWEDDQRGPLVFLMLNPSKADADQDDNTIRRCIGFAQRWEFCGLRVVNLYALRSTDPKQLWKAADPVGPDNDQHIIDAAAGMFVIAAWGANAKSQRVKRVCELIRDNALHVQCLGLTKHGHPQHPLFVRGDTQPIPFKWKEAV